MKEALKEALEFERKGKDIYATAAAETSSEVVKRTFSYLAEQEAYHITVIEKYIAMEGVDSDMGDAMGEVEEFFNMTMDDFKEGIEMSENDVAAYENAMLLERSSYDFYSARRDETDDPELKKFFTFVMEQERAHFLMLEKTLHYLKDPVGFNIANEEWSFEG